MKTGVLMVAVLAAVLIVGGLVYFRSAGDEDIDGGLPGPSESLRESLAPGAASSNQYLQRIPSDIPSSSDPESASQSPSVSGSPAASLVDIEDPPSVTISMNDEGFSPRDVTVASRTTVIFVNNGQGLHWPASDVHPVHNLLPEFDSKKGLSTGESYSFRFTEKGTWSMHDHLNPKARGTIIVE